MPSPACPLLSSPLLSCQAHTELSLELTVLDGSSLDQEQRVAMATAAASVLDSPPAPAQPAMQYSVEAPHAPWLTVLPLCAGFFDPLKRGSGSLISSGSGAGSGRRSSSPGTPTSPTSSRSGVRFAAALWNNAPIPLPVASAQVHLADALGSFVVPLQPEDAAEGGRQRSGGAPPSGTLGHAPPAEAAQASLPAGAWGRLAASIPVRCSGKLEATAVVLRFGSGASGCSSLTYHLPTLVPKPAELPASPRAGRPAPPPPPLAVGWLRGGWACGQPPFRLATG